MAILCRFSGVVEDDFRISKRKTSKVWRPNDDVEQREVDYIFRAGWRPLYLGKSKGSQTIKFRDELYAVEIRLKLVENPTRPIN